MSDQTENQETGSDLEALKAVAAEKGIKHHPSIGAKKLQKMIDDYEATPKQVHRPEVEHLTVSEITELQQLRAEKLEREANIKIVPHETTSQIRARIMRETGKLVRVVVNNMNPNKRDWDGEMYTVSNDVVKYAKYVPFNNEEGWHIPQMILDHLLDRQCQVFYNYTDDKGNKTRLGRLINELNVRILTPLTTEELQALAQRQAMARGEAA